MNQDVEHIKLLSIFHFVVAGIAALFACFPIFHLTIGLSMLSGGFFSNDAPTEMPFPFALVGLMFTLIPAIMMLGGFALAFGLAFSGYFLSQKRHYQFCLIMAGISCIFMPFGTVLGVFTILVITRPSAKELFNNTAVITGP